VWVTAERLPLFAALFPAARPEPAVSTPAGRAQTVSSEAALVEAVRGRLEGLGPTTAAALAAELAMPTSRIETALAALQAEGFEASASAWETEILPARIGEYEPAWLDEQCLAGRFVWTRLATRRAEPGRGAAPVRSTPIVLLARRNLRLWSSLAGTVEVQNLSPPAQRVAEYLSSHGAS